MAEQAPDEGVYLYGIVPADVREAPDGSGLFGSQVEVVPAGRVAAVVSRVPDGTGKIRPERRNLVAHQAVISRLTSSDAGVLPVAFGTVSPSREDLERLLSSNETDLLVQMERVGRSIEMEVRVELTVGNPFEYFVDSHPELREARDKVFGKGTEPTRDERIALGQLFQRVLDEERAAVAEKLRASLSPDAIEVKENDCRSEKELARLSVLVSRARQGGFDTALDAAARELRDEYTVVVTGPFPAYNFVDVHLRSAA